MSINKMDDENWSVPSRGLVLVEHFTSTVMVKVVEE